MKLFGTLACLALALVPACACAAPAHSRLEGTWMETRPSKDSPRGVMHFKGGKGLAAYWGMILTVNWKLALAVALGIVVITLIFDYIAIGSVSAAVVFPAYTAWKLGWTAFAIVAVASLVLIGKHKDNFIRIRNGTEVGFRRAKTGKYRVA